MIIEITIQTITTDEIRWLKVPEEKEAEREVE